MGYTKGMILNTFPNLLTYGTVAPFALRVVIGVIAVDLGYLKLGRERKAWADLFDLMRFRPGNLFVTILALIEIIGGAMLIVGAYTQAVAMVFAVTLFCESVIEFREETLEKRNIPFYILMLVIALSLIFSGAGAWAFDSAL